ncbi:hypothetical protein J2W27_001828 [Variovorax boronicumulans]|uniref:hypothetical protein n=1 Tax=Variovorax boronicumulans TaxID=436515 RepID=UPI0027803208|nr:hypothetical protein [Variovorax boronicumulans]MDP9909726.1 hypothetical protein [Variovorax boronicumulans]
MKVVFKLLFAYLVASLLSTGLALVLFPLHAHVPAVVVLLAFPLVPWTLLANVVPQGFRVREVGPLLVFVLAFGGMAWLMLRTSSKAAQR